MCLRLRQMAVILVMLLPSALRQPQSAMGQEVQWRHDYTQARREAVEKNRPLLVDVGTENCYWCKQLDLRTFRDPAIAAVLNARFIPLKIDAQQRTMGMKFVGEAGEAPARVRLGVGPGRIDDRQRTSYGRASQ